MRKNLIISVLAIAAFGLMASAQGLDPTVEVSRTYESTLKHTPKPVPSMAVPDSLLRFDLDFDYSVFDRPFKGSEDYRPYLLNLQPTPDAYKGKTLYFKAGLGYTLHPELDFVLSPELGKHSEVNIYAQNRSYFGKYRFSDAVNHNGYDSYSKVGVDGKSMLGAAQFFFNANYKGIMTKSRRTFDKVTSSLNGLEAMAGLRNAAPGEFFYSLALKAAVAGDNVSSYDKNLAIFRVGADGSFGKKMDGYVVAADLHFDRTAYSFEDKASIGSWYVTPRYIAQKDGLRMNIGVKIGSVMHSDHSWFSTDIPMYIHKSQIVYPDLHVAYELAPGKLDFYADLTGGDDLPGYEEIRERDHFALAPVTGNSLTRFNVSAGLRGNVGPTFRFDVCAGYRSMADMSLYACTEAFVCKKVYEDMNEPYLRGSLTYDCKPLFLEGRVFLRSPSVGKSSEKLAVEYGTFHFQVYTPREVTVDLRAMYSWKSRIKGGMSARLGSAVKGIVDEVDFGGPDRFDGFVDLGLDGEYAVDRTFSVYGRIGNLLNKKYFNDCLIPVSGLFLTAGVIFNL